MSWLFVIKHLAQVALVDHLAPVGTSVKIVCFPYQLAAMALAGDRWSEIG